MTNRKTDAYDSRCCGLTGSAAYRADFKKLATAAYVTKADGPFYCRECLSAAIVRKCSDKDDHFAHKARLSPTGKSGSTVFHHQVRDEICGLLNAHFPEGQWRTEVALKTVDENDLRADIAGFFGKRTKETPAVAVEVQCSPYSPSYIRKKTAAYAASNVHVIWIVPLTDELGEEEFRPRRYELYLHTLNLGYVFYYEPGANGLLSPVHYGPAFRYIESKTFFDSDATEVTVGGYYLKYKTLKEPKPGDQIHIQELIARSFKSWKNPNNSRLDVPERKLMVCTQEKWWPKNEVEVWLKDKEELDDISKYLPYYDPDDENDQVGENEEAFM